MLNNNKRLLAIAAVTLVGALGYGIVIPILYAYSQKYGLSDVGNGFLFAVFSFCQFVSTPVIGILSDKYGRRPLLIISLLGTTASFLIMAYAPNVIILFLARALDGITAGNFPVAQAVIADTTEEKDRAKSFGIIGACFGIGFIAGPAISAFTVRYSLELPFIIAAIISAISVLMTYFLLDETNKHMGKTEHRKLYDFKKLAMELTDPGTGRTLLIAFLWAFGFGMFIYAFQPFSLKVLHLNESIVSLTFVVFGVIGLISQIFIVGPVTKKYGPLKTFTIALTVLAISFVLLFSSLNLAMLIFALVVMSLANSTTQTLVQTLLSEETGPERQGEIMGIATSYMSIGQIVGPIAAGGIAVMGIRYPFLAGAALILIALYLTRHIRLGARKSA